MNKLRFSSNKEVQQIVSNNLKALQTGFQNVEQVFDNSLANAGLKFNLELTQTPWNANVQVSRVNVDSLF